MGPSISPALPFITSVKRGSHRKCQQEIEETEPLFLPLSFPRSVSLSLCQSLTSILPPFPSLFSQFNLSLSLTFSLSLFISLTFYLSLSSTCQSEEILFHTLISISSTVNFSFFSLYLSLFLFLSLSPSIHQCIFLTIYLTVSLTFALSHTSKTIFYFLYLPLCLKKLSIRFLFFFILVLSIQFTPVTVIGSK